MTKLTAEEFAVLMGEYSELSAWSESYAGSIKERDEAWEKMNIIYEKLRSAACD